MSENIGACARAIKNFNFNKLLIIKPKPLFPNDKIIATAVGAKEIIKNCKVFNDLESSIKNIDYLSIDYNYYTKNELKKNLIYLINKFNIKIINISNIDDINNILIDKNYTIINIYKKTNIWINKYLIL